MSAIPADTNGKRICEIFSYPWKWISRDLQNSTANWETNTKYPIKPRTLWARHQDAGSLVGVRFGSSTAYALIDIDANSPYIDRIPDIEAALETIGICRSIKLRSSWSGGIHIYLPLPKRYPTFSVACLITDTLEAQGFKVSAGEIECFPNVKSYAKSWLGEFVEYNAHRLPLQPGTGSCLLDEALNPLPWGEDLSRFFALWDNAVLLQDVEFFNEAISIARNNRKHRRRKATGPVQAWQEDLEQIISEGWTGPGQTNDLLKQIACYGRVFERLGGEELAEYVERIATSRPGYERWCRHQHEIWRRSCIWAKAAEKFYWPLGDPPLRERTLITVCQERAAQAQQRITDAVRELRFETGLTVRELVRRITRTARCSAETLYKYRQLWHPDQKPVTAQPEADTALSKSGLTEIRQALQTLDISSVTGQGGNNEVWGLKSSPKNLLTPGEQGGL